MYTMHCQLPGKIRSQRTALGAHAVKNTYLGMMGMKTDERPALERGRTNGCNMINYGKRHF